MLNVTFSPPILNFFFNLEWWPQPHIISLGLSFKPGIKSLILIWTYFYWILFLLILHKKYTMSTANSFSNKKAPLEIQERALFILLTSIVRPTEFISYPWDNGYPKLFQYISMPVNFTYNPRNNGYSKDYEHCPFYDRCFSWALWNTKT